MSEAFISLDKKIFDEIVFMKLLFISPEGSTSYIYFAKKGNKNVKNFSKVFIKKVVNCLDIEKFKNVKKYIEEDEIKEKGWGDFYDFIDFNKLHERFKKYGIFYLDKFEKCVKFGAWTTLTYDFKLEEFNTYWGVEDEVEEELQKVKQKYHEILDEIK